MRAPGAGIVALIPARGGSKGVPRKNVAMIAGKPLIAWTIEVALQVPEVERVVVSTDDEQIAGVARDFGAEVPFRRPPELATDTAADLEVFRHVVGWLEAEAMTLPRVMVWLRPTCPLRLPQDVSEAIRLLEAGGDSVRSVCEAEHHPFWMKTLKDGRLESLIEGMDEIRFPRRQLLPAVYRLNGVVDAMRCTRNPKGPLFGRDVRGYVMPVERSWDIDTEFDLRIVEGLLEERRTA